MLTKIQEVERKVNGKKSWGRSIPKGVWNWKCKEAIIVFLSKY